MAVWSVENSVVTNKGLEVLSKVQAGFGKIVIDSVVTGAGTVSAADLRIQTAVKDEKQVMKIVSSSTLQDRSILDVQVTNEDLVESYPLNQIGVYVTHEDFEGKILYLLAQATTPDVVPTPDETPFATLNYSLDLKHENTQNVSIQVDPSGLITIDIFDEHKRDKFSHYAIYASGGTGSAIEVASEDIVSLVDGQPLHIKLLSDLEKDATLKLNDGQEYPIYSSDGNPVLGGLFKAGCVLYLTFNADQNRWYITGGGSNLDPAVVDKFLMRDDNESEVTEELQSDSDLLGGYPPSHFANADLNNVGAEKVTPEMIKGPIPITKGGTGANNAAAALARLGAGVRPNLLDNPFFAVNQRGQTSYTTTGYTVDRWGLITSTETLMTVQADGVVLTASSQYGSYLYQIIPPEEVARLRGETVCFSAFCGQNDNVAWYANIYVDNQWRDAFPLAPNTVSPKAFTVPEDAQRIHLSFGSGAAGSCKLRAAKVELGNTQTLGYQDEDGAWHLLPQPESDYATQLARCQRYQIPIDGTARYPIVQIVDANTLLIFIPLPVTMRTAPALSDPDGKLIIYDQIGAAQTGFTFDVAAFCSNGIILRAQKVNHGITGGFLYVNVTTGVDAPFLVANL